MNLEQTQNSPHKIIVIAIMLLMFFLVFLFIFVKFSIVNGIKRTGFIQQFVIAVDYINLCIDQLNFGSYFLIVGIDKICDKN